MGHPSGFGWERAAKTKATTTAKAKTNTGVLRFAQNDDVKQATATVTDLRSDGVSNRWGEQYRMAGLSGTDVAD
jgi:hypothetical protein